MGYVTDGRTQNRTYSVPEDIVDKISGGLNNKTNLKNIEIDPKTIKNIEDVAIPLLASYRTALDLSGATKDPLRSMTGFFSPTGKMGGIDPPNIRSTRMFFTRPHLNFSDPQNVSAVPIFQHYAKTELGEMLMGLLQYFSPSATIAGKSLRRRNKLSTPFIPLLSNAAKSSSGGSDMILNTYTTQGDQNGHKLVYAKTAGEVFGPGTLSVSFEDVINSPIMLLHMLWVYYIHHYGYGTIMPRLDMLTNRRIEYTSSIYIFMLDSRMEYIERWTKFTGAFPISVPFGQILHDVNINVDTLRSVNINYQYSFQSPYDPSVFADFNHLVWRFIFDEKHGKLRLRAPKEFTYPTSATSMRDHSRWDTTGQMWKRHPLVIDNKLYYV